MPLTLDPAKKYSFVNLLSGNLAAQNAQANVGGFGWVEATLAVSGKQYAEFLFDNATNGAGFGVGDSATQVGNNPNGKLVASSNGFVYANGVAVNGSTYGTFGTGDVGMLAIDEPNGLVWFGVNGVWWNGNPSAGTGGAAYAATGKFIAVGVMVKSDGVTRQTTCRFTAASQTYAAPTGFTAADGAAGGVNQPVTSALLTNLQTFYGPTLTPGAVTVAPTLLANAQPFFAATVSPGAVTLAPPLLITAQSFFAPTIGQGAVTIAAGVLTNGQSFFGPTVQRGTVTIAPPLLANSTAFHSPAVSTANSSQTVAPALFSSGQAFPAATLTRGGVSVTAPLVANVSIFPDAIVTSSYAITTPLLTNANSLFWPSLSLGMSAPLVANDNVFFGAIFAGGTLPRTYPLAGLIQSHPLTSTQTYPLAGQTQSYPLAS